MRIQRHSDDQQAKRFKVLKVTRAENLVLYMTKSMDLSDLEYLLKEFEKSQEELDKEAEESLARLNEAKAAVTESSRRLLRSFTMSSNQTEDSADAVVDISNPMVHDAVVISVPTALHSVGMSQVGSLPSADVADSSTVLRRMESRTVAAKKVDSDDEETL